MSDRYRRLGDIDRERHGQETFNQDDILTLRDLRYDILATKKQPITAHGTGDRLYSPWSAFRSSDERISRVSSSTSEKRLPSFGVEQ